MSKRIGFVGLVLESPEESVKVNALLTEFADLITGRIGIPDPAHGIAVIGLIVKGTNARIGAFTGKLGNLPGVSVRSALTAKEWEEE